MFAKSLLWLMYVHPQGSGGNVASVSHRPPAQRLKMVRLCLVDVSDMTEMGRKIFCVFRTPDEKK